MPNLSEKELSAINELLSEEELLTKKFRMLAGQTDDEKIKAIESKRVLGQSQREHHPKGWRKLHIL